MKLVAAFTGDGNFKTKMDKDPKTLTLAARLTGKTAGEVVPIGALVPFMALGFLLDRRSVSSSSPVMVTPMPAVAPPLPARHRQAPVAPGCDAARTQRPARARPGPQPVHELADRRDVVEVDIVIRIERRRPEADLDDHVVVDRQRRAPVAAIGGPALVLEHAYPSRPIRRSRLRRSRDSASRSSASVRGIGAIVATWPEQLKHIGRQPPNSSTLRSTWRRFSLQVTHFAPRPTGRASTQRA